MVFGGKGNVHLFQGSKTKGNRVTRVIFGTGNIENQDFDFNEQG